MASREDVAEIFRSQGVEASEETITEIVDLIERYTTRLKAAHAANHAEED